MLCERNIRGDITLLSHETHERMREVETGKKFSLGKKYEKDKV